MTKLNNAVLSRIVADCAPETIKTLRSRLLCRLRETLKTGEIRTLSSGMKSNLYVDGKMVTLDPEGAWLIAAVLFDQLRDVSFDALGGLVVGADPIAAAFTTYSYLQSRPIPTFLVRKEPKQHGLQKTIEGPIEAGWKVVIVDDVVTTGQAVRRAIDAVEAMGCEVVRVVALIDREAGGGDTLKSLGYDFEAIARIRDFDLPFEVHTSW